MRMNLRKETDVISQLPVFLVNELVTPQNRGSQKISNGLDKPLSITHT